NAPLVIADRFGIKGAVTTQKRVVTTQNPSTERHLSTTAKILYGRAVHIDAPCFPLTDRKQDGADRVDLLIVDLNQVPDPAVLGRVHLLVFGAEPVDVVDQRLLNDLPAEPGQCWFEPYLWYYRVSSHATARSPFPCQGTVVLSQGRLIDILITERKGVHGDEPG